MNVKIEESWKKILASEFQKDYFKKLTGFVKNEYHIHQCFPSGKIFLLALIIVLLIS